MSHLLGFTEEHDFSERGNLPFTPRALHFLFLKFFYLFLSVCSYLISDYLIIWFLIVAR